MPLLLLEGEGRGRMSTASRRLNTSAGLPASVQQLHSSLKPTRACFPPFCCHYLVSANVVYISIRRFWMFRTTVQITAGYLELYFVYARYFAANIEKRMPVPTLLPTFPASLSSTIRRCNVDSQSWKKNWFTASINEDVCRVVPF